MQPIKKYFILFAVFAVVVIVVFFAPKQSQQPSSRVSPTPYNISTIYRGVDIETATTQQVLDSLGTPVYRDVSGGETTLIYSSSFQDRDTSVELTSGGSVKRIIEPLATSVDFSIVTTMGKPEIELFGKHEDLGFRLFVFATSGTAFLANPNSQEVRERWYFPRMTTAKFLSLFGEGFSTQPNDEMP